MSAELNQKLQSKLTEVSVKRVTFKFYMKFVPMHAHTPNKLTVCMRSNMLSYGASELNPYFTVAAVTVVVNMV